MIWSRCDGQATVESIVEALEQAFDRTDAAIRNDVLRTLGELKRQGFIRLVPGPRTGIGTRSIDLRTIPIYVINCKGDEPRREHMQRELGRLGLSFAFVEGVKCDPGNVGVAISHLKILKNPDFPTPLCILEDDCIFNEHFRYEFTVPADADALYLGVSRFGIEVPGELSWGRFNRVKWRRHDRDNLRVYNMLARHAVVYLNADFRKAAVDAMDKALFNFAQRFPGDVGLASTHLKRLVLTPLKPICYQGGTLGGNQTATEHALSEL